jgi:hypothetical protein
MMGENTMKRSFAGLGAAMPGLCLGFAVHASARAQTELDIVTACAADNFQTQNLRQYADVPGPYR